MSGKKLFTSEKNVLKRHPISGSMNAAAPSTLSAWSNYVSTAVIPHNLGYVPRVRVYYEPFSNGKVYPATGRRLSGTGPGLGASDVMCLWELDENNLTIYLESTVSKTTAVPIYWVVYLDN